MLPWWWDIHSKSCGSSCSQGFHEVPQLDGKGQRGERWPKLWYNQRGGYVLGNLDSGICKNCLTIAKHGESYIYIYKTSEGLGNTFWNVMADDVWKLTRSLAIIQLTNMTAKGRGLGPMNPHQTWFFNAGWCISKFLVLIRCLQVCLYLHLPVSVSHHFGGEIHSMYLQAKGTKYSVVCMIDTHT